MNLPLKIFLTLVASVSCGLVPPWHSSPVETDANSVLYDNSDQLLNFQTDTTWLKKEVMQPRTGSSVNSRPRTLPLFLVRFLSIFELQRVVREMENSAMSHVSCTACTFGVKTIKYLMKLGLSDNDIASAIQHLCTDLKIESPRVCLGVVNVFKDEMFYVFSKTNMDVEDVCSTLVGESCGNPHPDVYWNVTLPKTPKPPVKPVLPPKPGSPTLKVLHISDPHLDPYYKEKSDAECGEPLCCREGDSPAPSPQRSAGKWGDYRKCDTPTWTLDHMLNHIVKNHKIDYVIWTGDLPPHDIWNQTRNDQLFILKKTTEFLMKYFPRTPIFPALGNHESAPVNSFPPPFVTGNNSISWLYDALSDSWSHWLPQYTQPTIHKGAFYSVLVSPSFRVISINMNYCNNKNWWLLLNMTDPAEELQWLIYELQYAEYKGEKVHIIGHIPPGFEDCVKIWSKNYNEIINRFESTVVAQFFGHTHADEFEVFYDEKDSSRATNVAYIGPSVTPYVGFNPAYRIYTVDGIYVNSSYAILDHENYMMNLDQANKYGEPQWQKLYSAKSSYQMKSLQPKEWDSLIQRMVKNETVFQDFYKFYHRASPVFPSCDAKCKVQLICALKTSRSHDPSQCAQLRRDFLKLKP